MSRSVDSRIVEMKFENGKFKNNIKETIESLKKLKEESDFKEVQKSAENFDLSKVRSEVNSLNVTFKDVLKLDIFKRLADGIIDTFTDAFHVIPNLWNKAINQIKTGGWSRATNIDQATFQLKGLGIAIEKVNEQINAAVEGTAFGYDQAAKAASQLATSQVKINAGLKDMTLKGGNGDVIKKNVDEMERALGAISGIAASTNAQFNDIADIFTDAAGRGKVSADTFNRIAQRGLNASGALAKSMGISEAAVKDLVSKGKISFQEFADAMYETFYLHAKDANSTFEGSLANMKAALSRLGQPFAKSIRDMMIDPFNELKEAIKRVKKGLEDSGLYDYFDKLTKVVGKVFSTLVHDFREADENFIWVKNLTQAFKNLVDAVVGIVIPIKDAFKTVFGKSIMNGVNSLTESLVKFTEKLKPTGKAMGYIRMGFEGLFQILKSIGKVITGVISGLTGINTEGVSLLGWLGRGVAISLKILGILAEFITDLIDVEAIINGVTNAINFLVKCLKALVTFIGGGLVYAFSVAYDSIKGVVDLLVEKVKSPSSNPLIILIQEITKRIKEIPTVFPKAISQIKYFFKSFNAADSASDKFATLSAGLNKLKNNIVNTIKNISNSIRSLGNDSILTRFIASVVSGIGTIINYVGEFAIIVGSVIVTGLAKAVDAIKNFFAVFSDNLQKFNGNVIIAFWKTFTDGLKNFVSNLPKSIEGIKAFFESLNILDTIKDRFSRFINWLSEGIKKIKDVFSTLGVVKVYAADFNESVDSIAGATEKSKWDTSGIQSFIDKLKEFATNGGLVKLAILGINGALIAVMIQFARFLGSATLLNRGLTRFVGSINRVKNSIGEKGLVSTFKKASMSMKRFITGTSDGVSQVPGINLIANAILKLTASVGVLVGALMLLAKFTEEHDISAAGGAMAALGAGIFAFVAGLAILNQFTDLSFLFKFSKAMLIMSASMIILVQAMNNIDASGDLRKRFEALAGMMGLLLGASFLLSLAAPKLWKGALSLIAFATVIKIFTKVLDLLPNVELSLKNFYEFGAGIFLMAVFLENAFNQFSRAIANIAVLCLSIAASAAILTGVVMAFGNYKGDIKKGLIYTAALVGIISLFGVLIAAGTKLLGGRMPKFNASLITMAVSVAILAKVTEKLGELDENQLKKGVSAITEFMVYIALFEAASALTAKAQPLKFAASLVLITGCIALLSGMAALIGLIPDGVLDKGQDVILKLMGMVMGLMLVSAATAKANYGAIIASIVAVSVLMGEILLLSNIVDWDTIDEAIKRMGIVVAAYAAMMVIIGQGKYNAGTVGAMLTSVAVVAALAGALYLLATKVTDWHSLIAPTIAIGVVLGVYTRMLNTLGKRYFEPASLKVLLVGALVLGEIGLALFALNAVGNWASILASVFAINNVLSNLFNVLELVSQQNLNIKQIGNFLLACTSLLPVGIALTALASQDWLSILMATGAFAASIWAMSNALTVLSTWDFVSLASSAAAILIVSGAIRVLASAFVVMSEVNWSTIGMAGAALGGIVAALMLLGLVAVPALLASAAILAVSAALDLIALAMIGAAFALQLFMPSLTTLAGLPLAEIGAGLVPLAGGLALLGLSGVTLGLGGMGLTAFALISNILALGLQALSEVGDLSGIPGPLALIGAAGLVLGAAAPGMLLGSAAITVLSGVITLLSLSITNASTAISEGIDNIVNSLQNGAVRIKASCEYIGVNTGAGMVKGVLASLPSVVKSAAALVSSFVGTTQTGLDINSPSKVMQWMGKMCGVGFDEGSTDADVWNGIKKKFTERINDSIIAPAAAAFSKLKNAFSGLKETFGNGNFIEVVKDKVSGLTEEIGLAEYMSGGLDGAVKKLLGDTVDLDEVTKGFTDTLGGSGGAAEALDKTGKAAEKTKDTFTELKDKISDQMDIFSEFERKTEMTSDKILANMQDQINGIAEWSKMMGDLAMRGINQGLLQKLADMGPKGYEYVHAFVTMTDEQLSQANQLYTKSLIMPEASANVIMNSFAHAGLWATQGFENGLDMEKFKNAGLESAMAVRDGFEGDQGLQIHSPSRVFFRNGTFAMLGLADGTMAGLSQYVVPAVKKVTHAILYNFEKEINADKFHKMGQYIIDGLVQGMASKEDNLRKKAEALAKIPATITAAVNKIASPSKVMKKLGGYLPEGLAIGIDNNTRLVEVASETMANTALSGLKDAIKTISDTPDLGLNLNPTITPVLDLSNVEKGSAEINKLSEGWDNMSVGVSTSLASNTATSFNKAISAKMNKANETQNGIDMLRSAISALGSNEGAITQNNTFNISGDNPREIADEVSRILAMQVERRGAVWA